MLASLRIKRGVKAPETEEEILDIILSLNPTVFTASADLEGLLQCVCKCVAVTTGCIYFYGFSVMCLIVAFLLPSIH